MHREDGSGSAPEVGYPRSVRYRLKVPIEFPRRGTPLQKLEHLLAIGGPIGFISWVPATFASLLTAAACLSLRHSLNWKTVAVGSATLFFLGGRVATTSERLLQLQDPRNVVIDEVAGQLLTFLLVSPLDWKLALAGFGLFRFFDVLKPFPARRAERLAGGWGVMADDIVAGIYAAVALALVRRWLR